MEAKRLLRTQNLKYSMLYPARLYVESGDRVLFFDDPMEVTSWLERRMEPNQGD